MALETPLDMSKAIHIIRYTTINQVYHDTGNELHVDDGIVFMADIPDFRIPMDLFHKMVASINMVASIFDLPKLLTFSTS